MSLGSGFISVGYFAREKWRSISYRSAERQSKKGVGQRRGESVDGAGPGFDKGSVRLAGI